MKFIHDDFMLEGQEAVRLYHDYAENMPIIDLFTHIDEQLYVLNKNLIVLIHLLMGKPIEGKIYWETFLYEPASEKPIVVVNVPSSGSSEVFVPSDAKTGILYPDGGALYFGYNSLINPSDEGYYLLSNIYHEIPVKGVSKIYLYNLESVDVKARILWCK